MDTATSSPEARVDTIVIGGSAGAFSVIREVVAGLPADFPAALLLCLHQAVNGASRAAELLDRRAAIRVVLAEDGARLEPGTMYVAVPDQHLLIGSDHLHLRRGAHENNFRPAIDPLFRSAAVFRGPRAVGVVLSGMLDDGAAGARALARTGGTILVQDPDEAEHPDMPRAALAADAGAEAVPVERLAQRLMDLAGRPCAPVAEVPWDIGLELKITTMEAATMENEERLGTLTPFNCPHCNGVLWEIEDGPLRRYRCHTGHAYGADSLSAAQEEALDFGLFNALRACRGRAELIRRIANDSSSEPTRERLALRASRFEEDADQIEAIIRHRGTERPLSP